MGVGCLFSLQRHLHMYQQSSYFLSRYFKWGSKNIGAKLYISFIFAILEVLLMHFKLYVLLLIFALFEVILRVFNFKIYNKTAIKKLVYTKRVIRFIAATIIISVLLIAVLIFTNNNIFAKTIISYFLILSFHIPSVILVSVGFIMQFIEKFISQKYINEAKKILKSLPNIKVIGVTGSYGKTSAKFILKKILSEKFNVVATPESYNTPMGIVRTIREQLKPETEIFIAEMGAKNIGDIKELCELVNPNLGIITSVGPQHLETFKSIENVAATKFELADYCDCFVNFNSEAAKEKAASYVVHPYGTDKNNEVYAENISVSFKGTEFDLVNFDTSIHLSTRLLGEHNVINIVGAASVALSLGVEPEKIKYAVNTLTPTAHRLEKKSFINGSILLDDSYNSNPEGSAEAVKVLSQFEDKTKVIVTPGMVELGEKEYELNYKLGELAAHVCDYIILVGEKRSLPLKKACDDKKFNSNNLFVVKAFKDSLEILNKLCNDKTVVLFENDLPDNYAG